MSHEYKELLFQQLKTLDLRLNDVESKSSDCVIKTKEVDDKLFMLQCELIRSGEVDGRNKETRDAQLYPYTKELLEEKAEIQKELNKLRVELNHWKRLYEITLLEAQQ